jgi:hypothetical protein
MIAVPCAAMSTLVLGRMKQEQFWSPRCLKNWGRTAATRRFSRVNCLGPFSGNAAVWDETMNTAEYYPYRTAAMRDLCFRYDDLAVRLWLIVSQERMARRRSAQHSFA